MQLVDKRRFLASRVRAEFGRVSGPLEHYNDLLRARGPRGTLDPLFPAILRAVAQWSGPVSIVHDQQLSLTDGRIRQLKKMAPRLESLTLVDSQYDARVQVADFLAGIARRVAGSPCRSRPPRAKPGGWEFPSCNLSGRVILNSLMRSGGWRPD